MPALAGAEFSRLTPPGPIAGKRAADCPNVEQAGRRPERFCARSAT